MKILVLKISPLRESLFFNIEWVRRWRDDVIGFMVEKGGRTQEQKMEYQAHLEKELQDAIIPVDIQK